MLSFFLAIQTVELLLLPRPLLQIRLEEEEERARFFSGTGMVGL